MVKTSTESQTTCNLHGIVQHGFINLQEKKKVIEENIYSYCHYGGNGRTAICYFPGMHSSGLIAYT